MNSKRSCPICYSSCTLHQLPCAHAFCLACIRQWAHNATNACPICRQTFNKIQTKYGQVHRFKDTYINFDDDFYDNNEGEVDLYDGHHCVICGDEPDQSRPLVCCHSCEGVTVHLECVGANPTLKNWKCGDCQNLDDNSIQSSDDQEEEEENTLSQPEIVESENSSDCSFYPWMEVANFSEEETRHSQNVRSQYQDFKEEDGRVMTRSRLQNFRNQKALQFGSLISLPDSEQLDQGNFWEEHKAETRRAPRRTIVIKEEEEGQLELKRGTLSRRELRLIQENQNLIINGREEYQKHSMVLRSHRKN